MTNKTNEYPYTQKISIVSRNVSLEELLPKELFEALKKDLESEKTDVFAGDFEEEKEPESIEEKEPLVFNYAMTNANQDLKNLTRKLKKSKVKKFGMLLWGVSGSGKSFYGQYLAQELGMNFIKIKASDIIDKYVGETEKNIRDAFAQAKSEKAVLVIDEADSFLLDRSFSMREHEVAKVNEILTQMEDHPYPFIMTTNLKDKIDRASLRRFIFKIKYDYMESSHVAAAVKHFFGKKCKLSRKQLHELTNLCAGDFKVVQDKISILEEGVATSNIVYEYLKQELIEKEIETGSTPIAV